MKYDIIKKMVVCLIIVALLFADIRLLLSKTKDLVPKKEKQFMEGMVGVGLLLYWCS